jgi:hypothetical protein
MSPKRAGVAGSATRTVTSVAIAGLLAPRPWTCSRWRSRSDGRPARCWSRIPTAARNRRHSPTPTGWISSALARSAARATPTTTRSLRAFGSNFNRELVEGRRFTTHEHAEHDTLGWIGWYNGGRLHEMLGGVPLLEYELLTAPASQSERPARAAENRTAPAAAAALGNASQGYDRPRIGRCPPPSPARQRSRGARSPGSEESTMPDSRASTGPKAPNVRPPTR